MQNRISRRVARALVLPAMAAIAAGCSNVNDPYAKIEGAPLVPATLHAATLVTDSPDLPEQLRKDGYAPLPLAPNYQAAIHVESLLWDVPEDAAGKVVVLKGPANAPDLRVLVMPLGSVPPPADAGALQSFYRKVLGSDVPAWPQKVARADNVRVRVWTFFITDILAARGKLREHAIATLSEPVGITTSYLGDEKAMTIRAPDGAIVELVQAATQ
jgi:hypothetical protein